MPSTILSDNGASSGTSGIKTTGSNDGTLALQTTTAGGTATTALTINTTQAVGVGSSPSYGTSGQVLTSAGSTASPTWTTVSGACLTTPSFTSTIGVGSATAATTGAGVTFPATFSNSTNANTLDDYEEGTFTLTLSGCTASPTATCYYTKIGNQVTFWSGGAAGTSNTNYLRFTGVPAELVPNNTYGYGNSNCTNAGTSYLGFFTCTTTRFDIFYDAAQNNFTTSGGKGATSIYGCYTTA